MTRLIHEIYEKPCLEAAAALFEAAMHSPHPLVAVAGAANPTQLLLRTVPGQQMAPGTNRAATFTRH